MPTPESLTIPDKLDSINVTKQAIRQAIVAKGVEVPEGTTFYEYAGLIDGIETGSGECYVNVSYGTSSFYYVHKGEQKSSYESFYADKNSFVVIGTLSDESFYGITTSGYVERTHSYNIYGDSVVVFFVYGDCQINIPGGSGGSSS